jgi:hypothetical protein
MTEQEQEELEAEKNTDNTKTYKGNTPIKNK